MPGKEKKDNMEDEMMMDMSRCMEEVMMSIGSTKRPYERMMSWVRSDTIGCIKKMRSMLLVVYKNIKVMSKKKIYNISEVYSDILYDILKNRMDEGVKTEMKNMNDTLYKYGRCENILICECSGMIIHRSVRNIELYTIYDVIDIKSIYECIDKMMNSTNIRIRSIGIDMCIRYCMNTNDNSMADIKDIEAKDRVHLYYMYYRMMNTDHIEIRLKCMKNVPIDDMIYSNVHIVLKRLHDDSDIMRHEVLSTMSKHKYYYNKLSIGDRIYVMDACMYTSDDSIKQQYQQYMYNQIYKNIDDIDSMNSELIVIKLCDTFNLIDDTIIRYLPRLHHAILILLYDILNMMSTDILKRVIRHICGIMKSDIIYKINTVELMIIYVLLYNSYSNNNDDIINTISQHMPSFSDINSRISQFYTDNKRDILKTYYMFKIIEYRINFIENDTNVLITNLDSITDILKHNSVSVGIEYRDFYNRYRDIICDDCSMYSTCMDEYSFIHTYHIYNIAYPPMILSSIDIYSIIIRIYRRIISDNNNNFTSRMIMMVNNELEKKQTYLKNEMRVLLDDIQKIKQDKEDIMNNKKINRKEIDDLSVLESNKQDQLFKIKIDYYRPLKKAVCMLDNILGVVDINRDDAIVHGLGKLLTSIMDDTSDDNVIDDIDYNIISHNALCKYVLIDKIKFIKNHSLFYQLLEIDVNIGYDRKIYEYIILLKSISLRTYIDSMFVHDMKELLSVDNIDMNDEDGISISYDDILNFIVDNIFSSNSQLSHISIDGIIKLVLHNRIDDTSMYVSYILISWYNSTVVNMCIQRISVFVHSFVDMSIDNIEVYEDGWERVVGMMIMMRQQQMVYNNNRVKIDIDKIVYRMMKTHVAFIRYDRHDHLKKWRCELDTQNIGVCERIYSYICHMILHTDDRDIRSYIMNVFNTIIGMFDFYRYTSYDILLSIYNISVQVLDKMNADDCSYVLGLKSMIDTIDIRVKEIHKNNLENNIDMIIDNINEHTNRLYELYRTSKDNSTILFTTLRRMSIIVYKPNHINLDDVIECSSDREDSNNKSMKYK